MKTVQTSVIAPEGLADLLGALAGRGYRVLGPTVRDGAIVYEELESADDLPIGWKDVQDAGSLPARAPRRRGALRLRRSARTRGSSSSSRREIRLWQATPRRRRLRGRGGAGRRRRRSRFIGVRACELHGIAIQDRVFLGGNYADRDYAARRKDAFIVAVNCFEPAGTCFCVSMGTGPKAEAGYDLALTEILDGDAPPPRRGRERARRGGPRRAALPRRRSPPTSKPQPRTAERATERMGRQRRRHRHPRPARAATSSSPRWDEVAARCLTCGNCTLVCPTCFCSSVEDVTDLTGDQAERHAVVGLVLLGRPLLHPRRQHPAVGPRRATASGSRTSSAPGTTSSTARAASAAGAASPGARSGST